MTLCRITGLGFKVGGGSKAEVRFACAKGFTDCSAEIINDNIIEFETPNYEKYGLIYYAKISFECRMF